MKFTPTNIQDVILIEPDVFSDHRGFFVETYNQRIYKEAGISLGFVQDNHSRSIKGTLRGLHYQIYHSQGKLIRAVIGEVFDVVVDLRKSSPTFKKWVGTTLSDNNKKQIWVPPGFAHGFYTVSDFAEIVYKTTDYYSPEFERSILWNDPDIGIEWPSETNETLILSTKDKKALLLESMEVYP
jgi:dTDP-4-dehydrorhamnose 3,5-epimerase